MSSQKCWCRYECVSKAVSSIKNVTAIRQRRRSSLMKLSTVPVHEIASHFIIVKRHCDTPKVEKQSHQWYYCMDL